MKVLRGRGGLFAAALAMAAVSTATICARADGPNGVRFYLDAAAARAADGQWRDAIRQYEDALAEDPRVDVSCPLARLYERLAADGDFLDIELAALHYERCKDVDAKSRAASLRQRLDAGAWVSIGFVGHRPGAVYDVRIDGIGCTTPCTLQLSPGTFELTASGAGTVRERIVIPDKPGYVTLQHENRRVLLAGAVLTPAGAAMLALAPAFGQTCHQSRAVDQDHCQMAHYVAWPVVGFGVLMTGISLLVTSSWTPPFANRVVVGKPISGRGLTLEAAGLGPLPGGAGGGVRFTF